MIALIKLLSNFLEKYPMVFVLIPNPKTRSFICNIIMDFFEITFDILTIPFSILLKKTVDLAENKSKYIRVPILIIRYIPSRIFIYLSVLGVAIIFSTPIMFNLYKK